MEVSNFGCFLKCSYFFSNFFNSLSGILIIWLLDCPYTFILSVFLSFHFVCFPGGFLSFTWSLLLNFLLAVLFFISKKFSVFSYYSFLLAFCSFFVLWTYFLMSSSIVLKIRYSPYYFSFLPFPYCYLFWLSLIFIVFFKKQRHHT